MKKTFLSIFILLFTLLALVACGGDNAPQNMQLVYGSESDGYYFYGPKDWVISNAIDVKCTYVSRLDHTSITFVDSELPASEETSREERVDGFFRNSIKRLESTPFEEFTLLPPTDSEGNEVASRLVDFGHKERGQADEAYSYVYTYKYEGKAYKTMQVFVFFGEDFYIFTYNSSGQKISAAEDAPTFFDDYYQSSVKAVIENFTFVSKVSGESAPTEYEKDENGNILVSDKSMCGFSLWVPESYKPDYSSGIVSVTHESGANITVSKLIDSTISIKDNYLKRAEKLKALSDKALIGTDADGNPVYSPLFTEIKGVKVDAEGKETLHVIELPNARSAAEFEYTYTIEGITYHVYQVYVVQGYFSIEAYVYTFTARESDYSERIEEAKAILSGMEY